MSVWEGQRYGDLPYLCHIKFEKLVKDMITFPNAKINLGLQIVERRPDGYHNLETVFYPIPVEDVLEVVPASPSAPAGTKYNLHLNGLVPDGPADHNLVVKAYRLLDEIYDLPPVDIHLLKRIPMGAGLGGGSSDAAFMLRMLDELFALHLTTGQLEAYAARLGADCAFFINNLPTFAHGIGNLFRPVQLSLQGYGLLLVKPDVFVSTRDAFARIRPRKPSVALTEVVTQPVEQWRHVMTNDFEESVFPQFPVIGRIKQELYRLGAVYAAMSGSGSSLFGLFAPGEPLPQADFGPGTFVWRGTLS